MVKIHFLGAPFVTWAEQPVTALNSAPALLRLLAFLVMRPQPHHRSNLASLFWPDLPEARARRTLNNLIWRLRSALPQADALLHSDQQSVQFHGQAGYWLDVAEFDQHTQALAHQAANLQHAEVLTAAIQHDYDVAMALYRADFLSGLEDDWCLAEREQWRERYFALLERFTELCLSANQPEAALLPARRLVTLDPLRERGQQRLLELYVTLGQIAEARTQFEAYCQLWQSELHLPPSADMLKLAAHHQLRPGLVAAAPAQPVVNRDPLPSLPPHPEYLRRQLEICFKNDDLYDLMADRPSQQENLARAQGLADKLPEPSAQIEVLTRRAWLASRQGHYDEALNLAHSGLTLCDQHQSDRQRAGLHRMIGVTSEEVGNAKAALHHYSRALHYDEALHVNEFIAADLNNVATTHLTAARYYAARPLLERAQALLERNPLPGTDIEVVVMGNVGYIWLKLGQWEKADHDLHRALTLAQRVGGRGSEWWLTVLLARLYHERGETTRALTFALQHYGLAQAVGDAWVLTFCADALAVFYADAGLGAESLAWAQQMQASAIRNQQWRFQVRSYLRVAQAQQVLAQPAAAFAASSEALTIYRRRQQTLEEEPELFASHAQCAAALGEAALAAAAQQHAQQALQAQLAAIPDPAVRQSFLRAQRPRVK